MQTMLLAVANFSFSVSCFFSMAPIPEWVICPKQDRRSSLLRMGTVVLAGVVVTILVATKVQQYFSSILGALSIAAISPGPVERFDDPALSIELVLGSVVGRSALWMLVPFAAMLLGICLQLQAGVRGLRIQQSGVFLFWLGFVAFSVAQFRIIELSPPILVELFIAGGFSFWLFFMPLIFSSGWIAWRFSYLLTATRNPPAPSAAGSGTPAASVALLVIAAYMLVDLANFCLAFSGNFWTPIRMLQVALPEYLVNGGIVLIATLLFFSRNRFQGALFDSQVQPRIALGPLAAERVDPDEGVATYIDPKQMASGVDADFAACWLRFSLVRFVVNFFLMLLFLPAALLMFGASNGGPRYPFRGCRPNLVFFHRN